MAKVDIDLAKAVAMRQAGWTHEQIVQYVKELSEEAQAIEEEAVKEPAVKKQYVVIVSDPFGDLAALDKDFVGWVVQIPEDDAPHTALERLYKGVYDFNITPKGRRLPIKTMSEACEFGSAKIYKEHKVWVKTKEPALLITTNGRIPRENIES